MKDKQVSCALFSPSIEYLRDNETENLEDLSSLQERKKRFARDLDDWKQYHSDDTDSIFPTYSKFYPEYGVMFNDLGQLVTGIKKTFLFVLVDILEPDSLKNIEFHFPDCQGWAGTNLHHWRDTEINLQPLRELVHQRICGEMNAAFRDLFEGIKQDWKQLKHVIEQQIPTFLPNQIIHSPYKPRTIVAPNGKKWYSRIYLQKQNRLKRAIPIVAIIAGVP